MIFSFNPVQHNIYLFHEHIAYIFKKMFATNPKTYTDDLVHPLFLPILNSANISIKAPLTEIIEIYYNLPFGDKKQLEIAFSSNNAVDSFYNKDNQLIKFDDLHISIKAKLKIFLEKLWTEYPQVNQMEVDFGTIKEHYDALTHEDNCPGIICPFCGIDTFEPSGGKYREAYDHLFAKAKYPFTSINLNILVPTCFKCNSNEKRTSDTLYNDDGARRAVYYPYDPSITFDSLNINIVVNEPYNEYKLETLLGAVDWEYDFTRNGGADEKLDSWNEIYGIRRKYRERMVQLEKQWFSELLYQFKNSSKDGVVFPEFQKRIMKITKYQVFNTGMGIIKYAYYNFLFSSANIETKLLAA